MNVSAVMWGLGALGLWATAGLGAAIALGRILRRADAEQARQRGPTVVPDGYATGRADLQLTHHKERHQ